MLLTRFIRTAAALLALIGLAGGALANDISFTGDVTYRERMALPPEAQLVLTLVALPGATRIVSASSPIAGSVPLQFTLNVRSGVVRPDGQYGLMAEIRSAGRTLFRNAQPVPVDALLSAPTLIVVSFAPDPAPVTPPPPVEPPAALLDIVWTVTSIGGDPVPDGGKLTLSIASDLRVGGSGGCNNYFTEASVAGSALSFGPVAGTRMACAPASMALEARFFAALAATAGYELANDALKLVDAAGIPLAGLVRLP